MKKNVGKVDAIVRILFGIFLLWLGLVRLNGLEGSILGILVAILSLIPFTIATTRTCPIFSIFKISSIPKSRNNPD